MVASNGVNLLCTGGSDGTISCSQWPRRQGGDGYLVAHDGGVDCVALAETERGPVVISAGRDGSVRAWDLTDVRLSSWTDQDTRTEVSALASTVAQGRSVVIGIVRHGQSIATWDVETGDRVALWPTTNGRLRGLAPLRHHEETLVATGDDAGVVRLWDPLTGLLRAMHEVSATHGINDVASGRLEGRTVVAVAVDDGSLHARGILDDASLLPPVSCHPGPFSVRLLDLHGTTCAVTASSDVNYPKLWNLVTGVAEGSSWQPCTFDRHYYWRFTVGQYGDRALAISVGPYSHVDVWDVETGRLLVSEEFDDGHRMMLGAVTVGMLDDQPAIVTSGYAGAVTIWGIDDPKRRIIETGSLIRAVALDGRSRVIIGGVMGILAIDPKHDRA